MFLKCKNAFIFLRNGQVTNLRNEKISGTKQKDEIIKKTRKGAIDALGQCQFVSFVAEWEKIIISTKNHLCFLVFDVLKIAKKWQNNRK